MKVTHDRYRLQRQLHSLSRLQARPTDSDVAFGFDPQNGAAWSACLKIIILMGSPNPVVPFEVSPAAAEE
jgi:hypothetical protein